MPPDDCRLEQPRRNAVVRGDALVVRGSFAPPDDRAVEVVIFVADVERARASPSRDGTRLRYDIPLDISRLPCRLALVVAVERASGEISSIHELTVWRPAYAPERPRIAALSIEAWIEGGAISGTVARGGPLERVDVWVRGVRTEAPLGEDGRFGVTVPGDAGAHLWAVYRDGSRPEIHLGRLPGRRARETPLGPVVAAPAKTCADLQRSKGFLNGKSVEVAIERPDGAPPRAMVDERDADGCDAFDLELAPEAGGAWYFGRRRSFQPLKAFLAADAANTRLALTYRDGRTEEAAAARMVAAGDDWTLVIRDAAGFRDVALGDLADVETTDRAAGHDPASGPPAGLKEHGRGLPKPRPTMRSDEPPFGSVVVPAFGERAPPREIRRVVLVRPGVFPTDELYVLAPLAPLLETHGAPLEVVTLSDGGDATRRVALGPRTVVVVSRSADAAWLDRLAADPRPFVIYLMDDDPPAAVDSPGLQHRYRRRMIEMASDDFQTMLRRCDRFLTTSARLAELYASPKTALIEPPFIRPAPSMAHLEDLSTLKVAYHATDAHREDIEFLYPAITRTLRQNPRIMFQLISGLPAPKPLAKLPNFELVRPMKWPDYKEFAAANPAHISLAPMLDTPFNAAKSTIKFYDAASLGAVGIYSAIAPYVGMVEDGVDGFLLANDPPAWGRLLRTLATSPKKLRRTAMACQRTASKKGARDRATAVWRALLGLD